MKLAVLIESDWNLKKNKKGEMNMISKGINRIRLEFKANRNAVFERIACSINRIRLEFKEERKELCTNVVLVLIESDWNLKFFLIQSNSLFCPY